MKNNKKMTRKTKAEKRRLAFEKRNVKKEQNLARYGSEGGSALVMAKTTEFNRRMLAALLALVFVLTSVVVGYNIATKAQGHDEGGYGMMETVDENTGMVLRKGYAVTDKKDPKNPDDDVYSLRLEAYSTKDTTQTPVDAQKTPLDIVMVLDQSNSMTTKDVLKGRDLYQPVTAKNSFTITDIQNGDYYYYDKGDNEWHKILIDSTSKNSYVSVKNPDGVTVKRDWTAQGAEAWKSENGKELYLKVDSTTYEKVTYKKTTWYENTGDIPATNFVNSGDLWTIYNNTFSTNDVYYYNSEGVIAENEPFWHQVFQNTEGVWLGGYYSYLWYYTEGEAAFKDGTTLTKNNRWGERDFNDALNANTVSLVPEMQTYDGHKYHAWYKSLTATSGPSSNSVAYNKGKLFTRHTSSSTNNYLYTVNDNNQESRKLAWPNTGANGATSVDSVVYKGQQGDLYTTGYVLYYEKSDTTPVYIGSAVNEDSEVAYTVDVENDIPQLYEKETITRLKAQQLAANNFAQQIAANIGARDYRIAVVGNANSGAIYSGNMTEQGAYVTTTTDVESAITALTNATANGTALSDGLTKAADVFKFNPLDPADARKRIVIVFGDEDSWASAQTDDDDVRTADATLKDTYNSTVYTIGLFNGTPDADIEQFVKEMSSEYFFTTTNASTPNAYKQMAGTYHYLADRNVFPDEANSIISTFGTVANNAIASPKTEFVLDQTTAYLMDVIHENFNLPNNPDNNIDVQVATGTYNNGELTWTNDPNAGDATAAWDTDNPRMLKVTGFDYDANYVSENTRGKKIIVTIDGLTVNQRVRTESKSAKRIYFNTTDSGIYKDGAEELVVNKFPRPFLDDKTMLAPEGGTGTMNNEGIVVNKYLSPTENGTYDLTVEAYTTQTSFSRTEKVPTDFIVVADQSGSMSEKDMPTGYKKVSSAKTLEEVRKGQYFVLGEDGNYYRVYGTRDYLYRYYPANYWYVGSLVSRFGTRLGWFMSEDDAETNFENQMYFREVVNGKAVYQPITMTVKGVPLTYYIGFKYNSALTNNNPVRFNRDDTTYSTNGNSPWYRNMITGNVLKSGFLWSSSDAIVQGLYRDDNQYTYSKAGSITTGMYVNYPMYDRHVGYTKLAYRDVNGTEHFLKSTTGKESFEFCNDEGIALTSQSGNQPTYSGLYEATGYQTRLEALQNALTEFATAVAAETNSDGSPVDNKIAIVGFSSPGFNNTELLTNENESVDFNANWRSPSGSSSSEYSDNGRAHDGVQKATADNDTSNTYYRNALVSAYDANTATNVNQIITDGIRALTAHGGTQPEDGLDMAKKILENRATKTYTVQTKSDHPEVDRHTIVIYFTDGRPGDSTTSNQYSEANDVVNKAKAIKSLRNSNVNETYPSVFSIGVFGESDGNPLTYNETNLRAPYNDPAYWEYMGGYVETYESYGSRYCLRRQWRPGNPDYTDIANDTIFDYMSVTSSNYPDANNFIDPTWLSGNFNGNYIAATDGAGVRSKDTARPSNDYYRMASNQATLVAAFAQAVTMTNETISDNQRLDAASVMQDVFNNTNFTVQDGYSIRATTVDGSMDKYGTVNFKEETEAPASGVITKLEKVGENQTVTVTGFDYLANYINYGTTNGDGTVAIPQHDGKKLVVTISNVVPTETGNKFFSNVFENNASSMYVKDSTVTGTDFPTPAISRHSYTLDVGDVNPNATFTVAIKILDGSENEVSKDANALADVILVYPNGTRKLYSEVGPQEFLQVGNGQSFYLENLPSGYENLPSGYQVETKVTSTDDAYKYYLTYDTEAASEEREMKKGFAIPTNFSYADHTIHIRSERGKKDVSVRERTIGSYGDTTHRFGEVITMEIPVLQGENLRTEFDCTFNDDFSGFENGLPSNATNYKAVFTVENPDATDKKVAKLTAISYIDSNGAPGTWSLANGETPLDYELPMRDGDVITFKDVPTGNTVKAIQPEKNKYEHEVFYYYGQDDVSPSGIKLMSSNGDLLSGTHTLTLKEVDGLENDRLTVTFVDGSITEIDGNAVDANTTIDFAKYETIFVIAEDENDNLSDAKLNIDGTEVYFDTESDGNDTAYVATIKRQTNRPPVSVTVEKNNMDILIINERGDIEIEGIFDNNHNWIIYILVGIAVIAVIAGGIFLWKKKDEFVEQ